MNVFMEGSRLLEEPYLDVCLSVENVRGETSFLYDFVTFSTCVINFLVSPIAVVGNSLVLLAIYKNQNLRTPSFLFLGVLALSDLGTGMVSQPLYILYKLAEWKGNKLLFCYAFTFSLVIPTYLSAITMEMITLMAVERWLHVSRRSLITVRRAYILCGVSLLIPTPYIFLRSWTMFKETYVDAEASMLGSFATVCFVPTSVASYKVFQIIRRHRQQIQGHVSSQNTGQSSFNLTKFEKSVRTILYILILFVLSFLPSLICTAIGFNEVNDLSEKFLTVHYVSTTILFLSSALSPLLYCLRIKEIRDEVKRLTLRMLCAN